MEVSAFVCKLLGFDCTTNRPSGGGSREKEPYIERTFVRIQFTLVYRVFGFEKIPKVI